MPVPHDARIVDAQVMGSADFHPNPCVLICPFAHEGNCGDNGKFRLNGPSRVSQLYSHWKVQHAGNPAAAILERRWRMMLKNKMISLQQLDAGDSQLDFGDAQLDLGDDVLRSPADAGSGDRFCPPCSVRSPSYASWMGATGTI